MPAKQSLSAVLALLLAVSFAAPRGARALSDAGFEYTVSAGAAIVTGCAGTCLATLVIPSTLAGYSVTSIGDDAFRDSLLINVTIPNSVTSIGRFALRDNLLINVTIPNSVTTIDVGAFLNNDLTSVTIGTSVTSIGERAFADNDLTSVTIGTSVTSIGNDAFANNRLTSVTFGTSVTSIGRGAFAINRLTNVTIPNSVESIGYFAFSDNDLKSVTIGTSVTSIGDYAFANNDLTSVTFGTSVTSIGNAAFENNLLISVTIPNSVESIGYYAFSDNDLKSVTIGTSVTSIGRAAFAYNLLTSVTFLGNAPTDGSDVFIGSSGLTAVTRFTTATGWGDRWSDVPVTAVHPPPVAGSSRTFSSIAAGGTHSCALTARGTAYCWGENDFGQLGDGTIINSNANGPQAVIGGLKFASIAVGDGHTCAITTRGAAYCWGRNTGGEDESFGQLGDGTTTNSYNDGPQAVIGGLKFASITAGEYHTCAITTRGAAYCWGRNFDGQLGDGTTIHSGASGPQRVVGGHRFASITGGEDHTCALTTQGAAYCWGYNDSGRLGDGTTNDTDGNPPQRVIGGHRFASISAGYNHICAITTRGAAYCWGRNLDGQLGDGTRDPSDEAGPQRVLGGHRFASLGTGYEHTCAATTRGRAYCWGYNAYGELGDGTTDGSDENGPQAVIGGFKFASFDGGNEHTCALTTRGTAYCWGANWYGQLGDGTSDDSEENGPQAVQ